MSSPAVPAPSTRATGPRTAEGKARSSQNARKHGFSAVTLCVLPSEQADFDIYQNELLAEIKPQPGLQADLFRQLVHAGWSLVRLEKFELELLEQGNPFDSSQALAKLDRIERYRAGHRRAYSRILAELRRLQTGSMLWTTAHKTVRGFLQNEFPLADPACKPLNRKVDGISAELDTHDFQLRQAAHDKTNLSAPPRPFGPISIE